MSLRFSYLRFSYLRFSYLRFSFGLGLGLGFSSYIVGYLLLLIFFIFIKKIIEFFKLIIL